MADADHEISGVGGGGGHPDHEIRGTPGLKKKLFSALGASGIIVMTEVRGAGFL